MQQQLIPDTTEVFCINPERRRCKLFLPDDNFEVVECSPRVHPEYGRHGAADESGYILYTEPGVIRGPHTNSWSVETNSTAHENPPYSRGWWYGHRTTFRETTVDELAAEEEYSMSELARMGLTNP